MNYMLLIAETQADLDQRTDPVKVRSLGEAWRAYSEALRKAGVFVRGAGLHLESVHDQALVDAFSGACGFEEPLG